MRPTMESFKLDVNGKCTLRWRLAEIIQEAPLNTCQLPEISLFGGFANIPKVYIKGYLPREGRVQHTT